MITFQLVLLIIAGLSLCYYGAMQIHSAYSERATYICVPTVASGIGNISIGLFAFTLVVNSF